MDVVMDMGLTISFLQKKQQNNKNKKFLSLNDIRTVEIQQLNQVWNLIGLKKSRKTYEIP